ncbi:helix-turn-helix domain-containing protein [Parafrankia sp. BMG5.11]|uniref:helix-turn-helix domain-containing protein n=1 Tax=Parafrankia sp. BMG5.11 TaxID=222540 RepID=UPI00103FF1DE|nr:XRE family transcriptional regulator [Parafrankia sp. BMG5.11]
MARKQSSLARRRRAMGYTQEAFADQLGVDRTTIGRWERGESEPSPDSRKRLSETLEVSPEKLDDLLTGSLALGSKPDGGHGNLIDDHDTFASGEVVVLREPITGAYVRSIHRRIESLLGLDHMMGGRQSAPLAVRAFDEVHQRMGVSPLGERDRIDAYAAAGELAEVAGWFLYEAADHAASRRMNHEALALTRLAGNRTIELLILQNMAMSAGHVGRPMEAMNITRSILDSSPSPTVEALFRFREALTHAQLGNESESRRALEKAVSLHSDGTDDSDPPWAWWVDDRQVSWFQGRVERDLKNAGRSIEKLADAVRYTPVDQTRSRYYHLADLMRAQVEFGAYSDAELTAREITEFTGVIKSGLVSEIFDDVLASAEMAPARAKSVVAALRDGLGVQR